MILGGYEIHCINQPNFGFSFSSFIGESINEIQILKFYCTMNLPEDVFKIIVESINEIQILKIYCTMNLPEDVFKITVESINENIILKIYCIKDCIVSMISKVILSLDQ